ncbi:MAG: hypothetical protein DPW16_20530 [Chloroflexi bacterium]|nr:hypothetical protein [Chloroflexota bacterium]
MVDAVQPVTTVENEILDFLAALPTPDEIFAFKVSDAVAKRMRYLRDGNRNAILTTEETAEFDEALRWEHFIRMLKGKVYQKAF